MTRQLSKADRIRKMWSDAIDGVNVSVLHDTQRNPWTVVNFMLHEKKRTFGVSCVNETSLSSLFLPIPQDRELSATDLDMNSNLGDVRTICAIMNGQGPAAGFVESLLEQMTFLSDTEKANLTPRLNNAWKKKLSTVLESAGVDLSALSIIAKDILVAPSSQSYAYYVSAPSPEIAARRHEAAQHYPFLPNLMATRIRVREAIDMSAPLAPALQEVMPRNDADEILIPTWMARRLNNPDMVPPSLDALHVLSKMPPDKFPSTDHEMTCANDIIHNLKPIMGSDPASILGKSFNGKWNDYRNSLIFAFADTRPPEGIPPASWEYIQKAIDFKAIQALSKAAKFDEVTRAAEVISQNLPLPPGVSEKMIHSFICRKYAPNTGESALSVIRDTGEILTKVTRDRFVLPMAMNMADMIDPLLTGDVLKQNEDVARSLLTEGRTALNVVRQFRGMTNAMNALMNVARPTKSVVSDKVEKAAKKAGFHTMSESDIRLMQRAGAWSAGQTEWATLTGPVVIRDFVVVPLVSHADVSREAEAMDHCIGDYHIAQALGLSEFHYSLRRIEDGWPVHVVTFSFAPHGPNNSLMMSNINGLHNSTIIPASASSAIAEFVRDHITPINAQMTKAIATVKEVDVTEQMNSDLPTGYGICGYDWRDKDRLEKVFEVYGPAMPKGLSSSMQALISSPAMLKAAKSIDPAARSSVMKALTARHRESLFAKRSPVAVSKPSTPSLFM